MSIYDEATPPDPSGIDTTIRSFMEVYRVEVERLRRELGHTVTQLCDRDNMVSELEYRTKFMQENLDKERNNRGAAEEKNNKLNRVIDSLKLELAAERKAHQLLKEKAEKRGDANE